MRSLCVTGCGAYALGGKMVAEPMHWVGGKMNPRIRLTSAKIEVGVEVEAELGKKRSRTVANSVLQRQT